MELIMNKICIFLLAFICSFVCLHGQETDEMAQIVSTYSEPEKITRIIVGPFAQTETSEECIELRDGIAVTDQALQKIGELYPALQILMVSGATITDEGLTALASGCPDLRILCINSRYINYMHNLSEEMLKGHVTDRGVEKIAAGCPLLESITLDGQEITDVAIEALARHCPELEYLCVAGLDKNDPGKLTDQSLLSLAEHSNKLRSAVVDLNPGITFQGVKALLESGNPLKTVSISHTSVSEQEFKELCEMRPDVYLFSKA